MKTFFKKNLSYTFVFLFLCMIIMALTGCQFIDQFLNRNKEETEVVREVPVFAVNTTTAVQGQIQDYISLS
jgi:Na+-transporting methylmalonyl-CoA/oxaloacetate decarboxylase gamma subunit